jgi:hypothetical protein
MGGTDHEVKSEGQKQLPFGKTLSRYQSAIFTNPNLMRTTRLRSPVSK